MNQQSIDDHVTLTLPDDWEIWEPSEDVLFVAAAPDIGRDDLQPHFFVQRNVAEHESSMDFMVANVIHLREQDGFVEHGLEYFDVNGHEMTSVAYDSPTANWVFRNQQYFLVVHGLEYLITCKMLPEQAAKWSQEFDNIMQSIEIADGS